MALQRQQGGGAVQHGDVKKIALRQGREVGKRAQGQNRRWKGLQQDRCSRGSLHSLQRVGLCQLVRWMQSG